MNKCSWIAIGRAGVGKSTIGNMFLTGDPEKPFQTSQGVDRCTVERSKVESSDRSFTDVPGVPDTDSRNNKEFYNKCVDAIKSNSYTALLFVFDMERINPQAYEQAGILMGEMRKANCRKILIVNDRRKYAFGRTPPDESEYSKLFMSIQKHTGMSFDTCCHFNARTMKDKIEDLVEKTHHALPKSSPHLKNFCECASHVERLTAIVQEHERELSEKRRILAACAKIKKKEKRNGFLATGALTGLAIGTGLVVLAPVVAGGMIHATQKDQRKLKKQKNASMIEVNNAADRLNDSIRERNIAQHELQELSRALSLDAAV